MLTTRCFAFLAVIALAGCPMKNSDQPDGAGDAGAAGAGAGGAGGADPDGSTEVPKLPAPDAAAGKPLAEGCATNAECASGFCTDGVCCASICDQSCYTCHLAGSFGSCLPQLYGDDPTATAPCTGAKTCGLNQNFLTSGSLSACNLKNLQKCSTNGDCGSGNCITYYTDADGDGYGSSSSLKLCNDSGAAAPPGFSTISGDCCDSDAYANPGVSSNTYYSYADACGSFDWKCDGTVKVQPGACDSSSSVCGTICRFTGEAIACN
jgi:hypothetical protein